MLHRLPASLVHQDCGAIGVQRVLKECEVAGAPDHLGRSRRIAFVVGTASRVLTSTAHNSGRPFGTKRPQVQILSPDQGFRRPEAPPELVGAAQLQDCFIEIEVHAAHPRALSLPTANEASSSGSVVRWQVD